MENAYPFDPLDSAHPARLLTLNPGEKEDPITCTLSLGGGKEFDPDYEALSYTWDTDSTAGTQQGTKVITCSGYELHIRENLFAALRRLRYPDSPRLLWVDAICINQADSEEKSQQVALMDRIYVNADEVIIWLGEEEADDALAFDFIRRLGRILKNEPEESDLLRQMFSSKGGPDEIPTSDDDGWRALVSVLEKRWFTRAWTVQEAALSRRATLVCGEIRLDFKGFLETIAALLASSLRSMLIVQGRHIRGMSAFLVIMTVMAKREEQEGEALGLFDLLAFTWDLQTTEPRDKIFSLLGMLKVMGLDTKHEEAQKSWSPDYNIPIDELFRKVIVYCLFDEGRFEILSLVNHGSGLDQNGKTSWILPRYIPPESRYALIGWNMKAVRKVVKPMGRYPCNHNHPGHIILSGVLVDQIRGLSTVWETPDKKLSSEERGLEMRVRHHRYISECELIHSELEELSSGDAPCLLEDAFWRTLLCGKDEAPLWPRVEYGPKFSVWREWLRLWEEDKSTALDDYYSREGIVEIFAEVVPFDDLFQIWSLHRRFCTTEGKRLGMVPRAAQVGDIICAFLGAKTPFVIRPDGTGNYRLVGECYVQGLMCGESADLPGFMEKLEDIVLV